MKPTGKVKKNVKSILSKIVIPKKQAGKGSSSAILYKMRYGSDWKKYYPITSR